MGIRCFFAAVLLALGCNPAPAPPVSGSPSPRTDTEQSLRAAHIATIQREADASYATWAASEGVAAHNAAQQLRFHLSERGVQVQPIGAASWQAALALRRAGCNHQLQTVSAALPQARRNRVEYPRTGLREWYVNGPLGLELGFDVDRQPGCADGDGLILELELSGALTPRERIEPHTAPQLVFADASGRAVLRFGELYAFDADGKTLPAALEIAGNRVQLRVDDRGARYPLTVDPLVATEQAILMSDDGLQNDGFGFAVAVSGDTALVGAWSADLPGKRDAGAAYVYFRVGTVWTQQAKLTAADAALGDSFGTHVAVDGDTAIVGALRATATGKSESGAAYVFVRAGTTWTQQAKLVASDADTRAYFGASVAVQGDTAVIGADQANVAGVVQAGAAYVFVRAGTTWTQQAKLVAADPSMQAYLGNAASLDGQTAVVGAYYASAPGKSLAGAAYIFVRTGTTWTQQAKLVASDAVGGDNFGISVSVSSDTALIGAYRANDGGKSAAGAAYVFVRAGTTWTPQARLGGSFLFDSAEFGRSVALAGDTAVIGAPFPGYRMISGVGYVFARAGTTWTEQTLIFPSGTQGAAQFGTAAALSGNTIVIGADLAYRAMANMGLAYVERLTNGKIDGTSCMADAECEHAHCVDGMCCDTACGGNSDNDCQVCSKAKGAAVNGTCGVAKAGLVCREAVGDCDLAEFCNGTNLTCGPDALRPEGTMCRAAFDVCDEVEKCTGVSPACPPNLLKPSTTLCRAKASVCDIEEFCTGTTVACPVNTFLPATTECRPAVGDCDTADFCTGTAAACPQDGFKPYGTVCRPAAGDCDLAEACSGTGPNCRTDVFKPKTTVCRASGGVCDVAESCTGTTASCPSDAFQPTTKTCRAAAGPCDAAELCTGTTVGCPEDVLIPKDTECRAAGGLCDAAELCSGTSVLCPDDVFKPANTMCRPAEGPCDTAELCTGTFSQCPTDTFKSSTTVCRPVAGVCDVAESCTGQNADCPVDQFMSSAVQCRPAAEPGDPAERCGGTSADCPPDVAKAPIVDGGMSTGCQFARTSNGTPPAPGGSWVTVLGLALLLDRRRQRRLGRSTGR